MGERDPDEGGRNQSPRQQEPEDGTEGPGQGRVEDEAGFAGIEGGSVCPMGERSVRELGCGFEPAEEVEVEIVSAGRTLDQHGKDGNERGGGNDDQGLRGKSLKMGELPGHWRYSYMCGRFA